MSDYQFSANHDNFNAEIKLISKGKYTESSLYVPKNGKKTLFEANRDKEDRVADAAFKEKSFTKGLFHLIFVLTIFKRLLFSRRRYGETCTSVRLH